MEKDKMFCHFLYCPMTGLGLYRGYRGDVWLNNRIEIFKRFTLPALLNQTNRNFTLWISWRPQEMMNPIVAQFKSHLEAIRGLSIVFTYGGVCFWDDKYDNDTLFQRLEETLPYLVSEVGGAENIYMTIQPSDDMYIDTAVEYIQTFFKENYQNVLGFSRGYIMNYSSKEIAEYNPTTTPPFYTINFPRKEFLNPKEHYNYIGPYKSHEYVGDFLDSKYIDERMFVVGCHGENISTTFNHSFKGRVLNEEEKDGILIRMGCLFTKPIQVKKDLKRRITKKILNVLPQSLQYRYINLLSGNIAKHVKKYRYHNP